ncbi:MAG: hypothetical protein ACPGGB_08445, partial [Flavobacteriales bacterium]
PTKARRVALRTAIAGKVADGELVVADLGEWGEPSARSARKVLADLALNHPAAFKAVVDQVK